MNFPKILKTGLVLLCFLNFVSAQYVPGNYTKAERKALFQLRPLVEPHLYRDFMKRNEFLIRYLRDQDLNVKKAQAKILATMKWRKENKIDTILDEEDYSEIEKLCPYSMDGRDRMGRPVVTSALGSCPVRKIIVGGNLPKFKRMFIYALEGSVSVLSEIQDKGIPVADGMSVFDISNFSPREHSCIPCIPMGLELFQIFTQHYPEIVSDYFIINMPRAAVSLMPILRPLLPVRYSQRLHFFGFNRQQWQRELFKYVAPDQLEPQFGGTKPRRKFMSFAETRRLKLAAQNAGLENLKNGGRTLTHAVSTTTSSSTSTQYAMEDELFTDDQILATTDPSELLSYAELQSRLQNLTKLFQL